MNEELFPEKKQPKPLECWDPETGDFVIGLHGWFRRSPIYGPDRKGKYWCLYGDEAGPEDHCVVCVSSSGDFEIACPPGDAWEKKKRLPVVIP